MESTNSEYTREEKRDHWREQSKNLVLTPYLRKKFLQDLTSLQDKIFELYEKEGDKVKDKEYQFEYGLEKTTSHLCYQFFENMSESSENRFLVMTKLAEELEETKIYEDIDRLEEDLLNASCASFMKEYFLENLENIIKLMPKVIDFLKQYEPSPIGLKSTI